ncbi:caspase family protein [Ideonella sp. DXS22W]|uniref:Caspase family protein n=1 Tax=Pseudaquabacterium inlustre TaxID=2984192 RepID=A0ABU9CF50_9BURK
MLRPDRPAPSASAVLAASVCAACLAWTAGPAAAQTGGSRPPAGTSTAAAPATDAQRNLKVQPAAPVAQAARRVALVIGNEAYRDAPLSNPVNDATEMARALQAAGFDVLLRTNADQREMLAVLREFGNRLRGSQAGVFYFAGHGMQIKGRNHLIPVGADIQREDEVAYQSLDAQAVLDKMESAGNGANLMILDACRNNPFARSFRSSVQGLAQMDAPVGTLVAFATSPGAVASDGSGRHGLYTQHLLEAMRKPGLKVEDVFKQVRAAVRRASQGKQVPWESTSLEGDFYLAGEPPPVAPPAPVPPPVPIPAPPPVDVTAALDDALWQTVQGSRVLAEVQAYLTRFPAGRHAADARRRVAELTPPPVAPPRPPAPVPAPAPAPAPAVVLPVPAPAPQAVPILAAPGPGATAPDSDRDRRTQQVLAELGRPPAAAPRPAAPTVLAAAPATAPPPAPIPAPAPAPAAASVAAVPPRLPPGADADVEALKAAQRQRTAELLAQLAPPVAAPVPPSQRNAFGFAAGDQWRYRVIDRLKGGDITQTYRRRIERVLPDGQLQDGKLLMTAAGSVVASEHGNGDRETWPEPLELFGALPRAGQSRELRAVRELREAGGTVHRSVFSGSLQVAGRETVRTPAGDFEALRVDVSLRGDTSRSDGGRSYLLFWKRTYWFAPELGLPVAIDYEHRSDSTLTSRTRHELVSVDTARQRDTLAKATP